MRETVTAPSADYDPLVLGLGVGVADASRSASLETGIYGRALAGSIRACDASVSRRRRGGPLRASYIVRVSGEPCRTLMGNLEALRVTRRTVGDETTLAVAVRALVPGEPVAPLVVGLGLSLGDESEAYAVIPLVDCVRGARRLSCR